MQKNEGERRGVEIKVPLLLEEEASLLPIALLHPDVNDRSNHDRNQNKKDDLGKRAWVESKKLWHIVGPAVFSRITTYSTIVITQVFIGHLGDLELASFAIAFAVSVGFSYPDDLAELSGALSLWMIPLHFSFVFYFGLQRFLQSQLKTSVIVWVSLASLVFHVIVSCFVYKLGLGIISITVTLNLSWWFLVLGLFGYVIFGGCPNTWTGFSTQAFSGLWEFFKLSAASGVMLCLETWYYRILVLMAGSLSSAKIAVDALSICVSINTWEFMIPLGFFAGTGVRVANELGAGNGEGAKFASMVSATTSLVIGLLVCFVIMIFHEKLAMIFTLSSAVLGAFDNLAVLLGITILLNSIQPVLSGVAVGSGWQASVAYINIGSYYIVGLPLGVVLGWVFHLGISGIWSGMIAGTAVQTLILVALTIRCDWDMQIRIAKIAASNVKKLASPNKDLSIYT
ncbi:hypothetical protein MKW94_000083 [Papaver nudicaule]|uniref:Protein DETOXIFICATION n=1 Tax=Papaver nudicaule TaxID=74823 RepID=A0AA42B103_PAPNU|nr:hypothetical protein [Papaver nudicaule]